MDSKNLSCLKNFKKPSWRDVITAILSALVGAFSASCAAL